MAAREGHVSGGSKLGKKRYQNSIKHRKTFSYQEGCDVVCSEVDGDMTRSVEVGRRSSFLVFRGHQGSSVGFLAFDQHLKRHDSVDWGFLEYMLYRVGMCDKWVAWMKACVCVEVLCQFL